MNTDMDTANYLMRYLQGEDPAALFEGPARQGLQQLEQDAKHAASVIGAQQETFEQRASPIVERVLSVNPLQSQKIELEELQQQAQRLQEVQQRLQEGFSANNQGLEKLTAQIAESRLSLQKTTEEVRRQKKAPDPRFELLSAAVTSHIRESH